LLGARSRFHALANVDLDLNLSMNATLDLVVDERSMSIGCSGNGRSVELRTNRLGRTASD
jgi:hypothetical protein